MGSYRSSPWHHARGAEAAWYFAGTYSDPSAALSPAVRLAAAEHVLRDPPLALDDWWLCAERHQTLDSVVPVALAA